MKKSIHNQTTTQFTEGKLNVTIQGDIITVAEIGFPADTFQIVETAPVGYEVWNIGNHMPKGYIPYAQCGGYDGRQVNRDTLKAVFIGDAKETAFGADIKEKEDLLCKHLERVLNESPEETYYRVIGCITPN